MQIYIRNFKTASATANTTAASYTSTTTNVGYIYMLHLIRYTYYLQNIHVLKVILAMKKKHFMEFYFKNIKSTCII